MCIILRRTDTSLWMDSLSLAGTIIAPTISLRLDDGRSEFDPVLMNSLFFCEGAHSTVHWIKAVKTYLPCLRGSRPQCTVRQLVRMTVETSSISSFSRSEALEQKSNVRVCISWNVHVLNFIEAWSKLIFRSLTVVLQGRCGG